MLDEKGDQLSQEVAVGYVEAVLQAELDMPLVWVLQKNNNKGTSCQLDYVMISSTFP